MPGQQAQLARQDQPAGPAHQQQPAQLAPARRRSSRATAPRDFLQVGLRGKTHTYQRRTSSNNSEDDVFRSVSSEDDPLGREGEEESM